MPLAAPSGEYTRLVQSVGYLLQREARFLQGNYRIHNLGSMIVSQLTSGRVSSVYVAPVATQLTCAFKRC